MEYCKIFGTDCKFDRDDCGYENACHSHLTAMLIILKGQPGHGAIDAGNGVATCREYGQEVATSCKRLG